MSRILYFVILSIFSLQSCITQETISSQAQFKSDTTSISNFVESNNPEAIKVNTGFWYYIDSLTNGVYPVLTDTVTISYTVKLIPSLQPVGYSTSTTLLLSSAIAGLQQGLILFPAGSNGQLYIPSGLAFGTNAHNHMDHDTSQVSIPPNANLLYDIKLISVKGQRLKTDIVAIDSYLASQDIVPLLDTISGIRYTIDAIDSAATNPPKPNASDFILVTYKEKVLTADTLITLVDTQTKIALKDQVTAWRIALPKYLAEGSTMTIYTPSGYAYGSFGKTGVPANTNLTYEITLIKVNP